jgi:hypothetical protein
VKASLPASRPSVPEPPVRPDEIPGLPSASGSPLLGRAGVIAACFALGVLGALGIATHVGGCGKAWP